MSQIDFDLTYLIDEVKNYNTGFFKDLDLEQYFDKALGEHGLVSSYYLFSSVNGILVYKTKDGLIYKSSDKLEPVLLQSSVFIKKFKANFELSNELISLVVYYNILPKSRILYVLNSYLVLISLFYLHFSLFVLYCIHRNANGGGHDGNEDDHYTRVYGHH
ncbi:hypothetical protein LKV13_03840 [Borrelia sp. BU AG58]|uniref:hypothetical protein n=1 Tax=Borrelia sp. BU AG58 TaxID=2887345 RepID=UPI001E37CF0D|nr:hypothetical protein [Borrelia sp. BU AG58]UER67893.1 hypothetical protein LKV13_03840 [Borrelia sp. BU AG58]